MNNTVYIYVNGILTFPGDSENWNGKAVTWTHVHTDNKAEKIEYFVGPIGKVLGQKKRSYKLARTMSFYRGWDIVLVGHSNGCDVIVDSLNDYPDSYNIKEIHLFAAACEADFEKNGLNKLGVDKVKVYIGERDSALQFWASTWIGQWLGYGVLGKIGPLNAKMLIEVVRMNFEHSEWFKGENFDKTMNSIIGVEGRVSWKGLPYNIVRLS
jgi:hypothetical protein